MAPLGKSVRVIAGWCNAAHEAWRPGLGWIETIAPSLEAFDLHSAAEIAALPTQSQNQLTRREHPLFARYDGGGPPYPPCPAGQP